jgi:hypothetical protein
MPNTANLMYEAIEMVRSGSEPDEILAKLDETFKSFQEFEKRYNADRLGQDDFDDLVRICRWCVMFDGVESRFDQIGRLAVNVLGRHGINAYVDGEGAVKFEKKEG